MALTADYEYEVRGHSEYNKYRAGAADTLYKGAMVNIGTDGYLKVAADVAGESPAGVMVQQHIADGTSHDEVEVASGRIWIPHTGAAQTDVGALFYATADDTLADSATNVSAFGKCIDWKTGYLLIDTRQKVV
jgi:hypothetical protein